MVFIITDSKLGSRGPNPPATIAAARPLLFLFSSQVSRSRYEKESRVELRRRMLCWYGYVWAWWWQDPLSRSGPAGSGGGQVGVAERVVPGLHDFDFLVGHWQVHHRKLKQRLVNSHEWVGFEEGTLFNQRLDGVATSNVDDTVFNSGALRVATCDRSTPSRGGG